MPGLQHRVERQQNLTLINTKTYTTNPFSKTGKLVFVESSTQF